MNEIKSVLRECKSSEEVFATVVCFVLALSIVPIVFWQQHWLCGVMSIGYMLIAAKFIVRCTLMSNNKKK